MKMSRLLVLVLSIAVVGCASPTRENTANGPKRQQNLITEAEFRDANYSNVYDAVAALRPGWLRQRGRSSLNDPDAGRVLVFMHGSRLGGADVLRQVSAAGVISLQFLTAGEAATRFGLQTNTGPVIVINPSPGT